MEKNKILDKKLGNMTLNDKIFVRIIGMCEMLHEDNINLEDSKKIIKLLRELIRENHPLDPSH